MQYQFKLQCREHVELYEHVYLGPELNKPWYHTFKNNRRTRRARR
jgi:hypothetical protein